MRSGFWIGVCALAALAAAGSALAQAPVLKPGDGAQAVQTVCTRCHTIGMVIARDHTPDEWNAIIGKMIDKGMMASDDQLDQVAAYLAKNYVAPASGGPQAAPAPK